MVHLLSHFVTEDDRNPLLFLEDYNPTGIQKMKKTPANK